MSRTSPPVRVFVVESPDPARRDARIARALGRLGPEASVEVVHDAAALRRRLHGTVADLVVVDEGLGPEALGLVASLRGVGPPVVFVARTGEEAALEAFRRGASDCVVPGRGDADALPVVALEQIRRWRVVRERGETERRLRWLERLPENVVEAIPTALAVLDEARTIVAANPAFARLLGSSAEALRGRRLDDVVPEALRTGALAVGSEAAAGRVGGPRLVRWSDDRPRAFDLRAAPLGEGRSLLVVAEVTEVEELLRQVGDLQRYTENIIQNLNSALLVVDREGSVTFANPLAEVVLGAPPGGLRGRSLWDWFPGTPRDEVLVSRTLRSGARFRGAETVVRRPDGSAVPLGVSCAPLVDGEGRRLGAVAVFQDLSEIKQLQRQVLQTEKMASIGQLAAGVAHEINNPMGFIHANLYQLSEYLDDLHRVWERVEALRKAVEEGGVDAPIQEACRELSSVVEELEADYLLEDMAKAVRESIEGSERIRHIVQDLRAFSHQDTSERALADVNKALDSTANIVWTMMKHSVVLTKQYQELPAVRCHPIQLKQVFMNLLVNAYQAIEERVAREGIRGEVCLRTRLRDGGVAVEVSDNGPGIDPGIVDRIFEPFFTTKEVGVGTGLGLSTSYTLLKRQGGHLDVRSEPGVGTTFEVWLPLDEEDEAAP